jgi:hypothetical protein
MNCCICAKSIPATAWTIDDGNLVSELPQCAWGLVCSDCASATRRPTESAEIRLSDNTFAQVNGYGSRHFARRASMSSPAEHASFDRVEVVIDGVVVDRAALSAADEDRVVCAIERMVCSD